MKACDDCKARVATDGEFCPLCGAQLENASPPEYVLPHNLYPNMKSNIAKYNFFTRFCIFSSLLAAILSVPINLLTTPNFLWCLIVIAGIIYCWATIPPLLRRGQNFASKVVVQVLFTGMLVVALDFIFGYIGWSVNYIIPSLLMAGTLTIGLMIVFNRINWAQYVLYQLIMGIFGFIPLILYMLGVAQNLLLVLFCAGISLASLLGTFIFGDRTIKSEFRRRFHF